MKSQDSTKVIKVPQRAGMNVCKTFHGNLSNRKEEVSPQNKNVNTVEAPGGKSRGSPKSVGFIFWDYKGLHKMFWQSR